MSPVVAVVVLFFSVLSFATSGEALDLKKEIEQVKKNITVAKDKKLELLKEIEADKKKCGENVKQITLEKAGLSADINVEMKKAKELLVNITDARTEEEKISKTIPKVIKSLERLVMLSKIWSEDIDLFKERRKDGTFKKCLTLFGAVMKGAKRSKNISDEVLLLENELRHLESSLSFLQGENDVLTIEKSSLIAQCERKKAFYNDAIKDSTNDLDSAKQLVKRFEGELNGLVKSISDKKRTIMDYDGKILKEKGLLNKLFQNLKVYLRDAACYKHLAATFVIRDSTKVPQ